MFSKPQKATDGDETEEDEGEKEGVEYSSEEGEKGKDDEGEKGSINFEAYGSVDSVLDPVDFGQGISPKKERPKRKQHTEVSLVLFINKSKQFQDDKGDKGDQGTKKAKVQTTAEKPAEKVSQYSKRT